MKYDYSFFREHAERWRLMQAPTEFYLTDAVSTHFGSGTEAMKHYEIVSGPGEEDPYGFDTPTVVRCKGAYFKGGTDIAPLEAALKTRLPDDFAQYLEEFGASVILTRSVPIQILGLQEMIECFEQDLRLDNQSESFGEARFFCFGEYCREPFKLGLRRSEQGGDWQLVFLYGYVYSYVVGPEGLGHVRAGSFYEWLKNLIDSHGYPDNLYPREEDHDYLVELID